MQASGGLPSAADACITAQRERQRTHSTDRHAALLTYVAQPQGNHLILQDFDCIGAPVHDVQFGQHTCISRGAPVPLQALHTASGVPLTAAAPNTSGTEYTWHSIQPAISCSSKPARQMDSSWTMGGEEHWVMSCICHALAASMYLWYGAHLGLHSWPAPGHQS